MIARVFDSKAKLVCPGHTKSTKNTSILPFERQVQHTDVSWLFLPAVTYTGLAQVLLCTLIFSLPIKLLQGQLVTITIDAI